MADLITVEQFTDRTDLDPTGADLTRVEALITDASALTVDIAANDTASSWDVDSDSVPASVVPAVVAMVRRAFTNPAGLEAETIGSYSYSGAAGVGVFATKDEVRAIRRAAGKSPVGSLDLSHPYPHSPADPYLSWLDGAV